MVVRSKKGVFFKSKEENHSFSQVKSLSQILQVCHEHEMEVNDLSKPCNQRRLEAGG